MNFKKFLPIFAVLLLMILSMGAVSAADVSNQQVGVASNQVKKYVETDASLPSSVTVGSENVTSPQFLYLLTKSTTNVNSGSSSNIGIKNLVVPSKPSESVKSGQLTKSQYITLADSINQFINTNGRLPNFANTHLGTMRYETLTYAYSSIMDFYITNKRLPNYVSVKPWSTISKPTPTPIGTGVSSKQIAESTSSVKSYIESNGHLPSSVTVGSKTVTSPQFLYLLTKSTTNVNSGSSNSIAIKNLAVPSKPSESVKSGQLTKSQYITLADSINQFINTNGRLPNFANTHLGTMRYETLTYAYSSIMDFYNTNKRLPNYVSITPWSETLGWTQLSYTYHHQTTEYTCGPSALKMAFSHYNLSLSESYLANVGGSDYYTGTSQNGMISAVNAVNNKYGTNYSMSMESFTGWNSIQSYLANGVPVIIRIRSFLETYGTHYVMISGINLQTGMVRLGDPSYNDRKPFSVKDKGVKIHEVSLQDLQDRLYWVINNKGISEPLMPLVKK